MRVLPLTAEVKKQGNDKTSMAAMARKKQPIESSRLNGKEGGSDELINFGIEPAMLASKLRHLGV